MAHRLGHCVVAEGVEHEEQKEYLLRNGCDKIQGFLVARPLDEEAALELIRSQAGTGPEST
jgi:EAL domain-containing protein (putative c-di-GMP-specific phosphodiesterase class I)